MVYTVVQTHLSSKKFRKMGYLGNFLRNNDIKLTNVFNHSNCLMLLWCTIRLLCLVVHVFPKLYMLQGFR